MEAMSCLSCGFPLGMYQDAFNYMREVLLTSKVDPNHIDKKFIDPNSHESLIDIFEALHIKKYCCRGQLASAKNMHDVGY